MDYRSRIVSGCYKGLL